MGDYLKQQYIIKAMEERYNSMQRVSIKYRTPETYRLKQIVHGDWIDLAVDEDISLKARQFKLLPLGVAMELPEGYEAIVAPRSSTFKKYGILQANSIGIIDESYAGDNDWWMFPAFATKDVNLERGTRIAQFRVIRHQTTLLFNEVDHLGKQNRGGFGSTGD